MDGEDLVVKNFFKKKKGFYIDVGCYHPLRMNNTQLLYTKGWNGINIDVSKFAIDLFNHLRPDDLNYNCAVSNKNEIIKLYFQKEQSPLITSKMDHVKKHFTGRINEKKIEAFSLDEIIERGKFKNTKIDFLDIDVEGSDFKVLKGLSFDKFQPKLICVEILEKKIKKSDIYNFLVDRNYELLWSGTHSHIFKRLEKLKRYI